MSLRNAVILIPLGVLVVSCSREQTVTASRITPTVQGQAGAELNERSTPAGDFGTAPNGSEARRARTGGEFRVAAVCKPPPQGHYNTFVRGAVLEGSSYHELTEMPMAIYEWERDEYLPLTAAQWQVQLPDGFRVLLREEARWSDGATFTARDVVTTFTLLRLVHAPVWEYLRSVQARGEHEVVFKMGRPSRLAVRSILREPIRAHAVYGEWAEKVEALYERGEDGDSPGLERLRREFGSYRPERVVASGPYQLDTESITPARLTLRRGSQRPGTRSESTSTR